MAAGGASASVDTLLADAISKMDGLAKRMDALEATEKDPIKGDAAKKADDDDDDDRRKDSAKKADSKKADDDDDDRRDAAKKADSKKADDDDDDDRRDAAKKADDDDDDRRKDSAKKADSKKADDDDDRKDTVKSVKTHVNDDGELEIKHKGEKEDSKKRADSKKRSDDDDDDKKDDSRKDSVSPAILERLGRLESLVKPRSDEEHAAFAEAQARADSVFQGFGQHASRPLEGESLLDYRTRLASKLKQHSKTWKAVKLSQLPESAFSIAEETIYNDAIDAAHNPVDLNEGELREITTTDPRTGQRTTTFYGRESFIKELGIPGRRVTQILTRQSV